MGQYLVCELFSLLASEPNFFLTVYSREIWAVHPRRSKLAAAADTSGILILVWNFGHSVHCLRGHLYGLYGVLSWTDCF